MNNYIPKTEEELKKLAVDIVEGSVFSNLHHMKDMKDLEMVFMPIALGAFSEFTEEELKDVGLIYEYLDKAGPRSVNGMPSFFSFRFLSRTDTHKVCEIADGYYKARQEFLTTPSTSTP